MKTVSIGEETLAMQLKACKIPFEREYKFHPVRKWRADFAFPESKLAVEIEGGIFNNGRHNRSSGFIADIEKYNAYTLMGWRLLRYTSKEIKSGLALIQIETMLGLC